MNITHSSLTRSGLALALAASVALFGLVLTTQDASAHTDPLACDSTGVSLSLTVLRADGTTPVGGGSVVAGETIKYRATLNHGGGSNCNYEGGDLDIITPDAVNHDVDGGTIPLVTATSSFVGSIVTYVVSSADVGGDADMDASAVYSVGTSHLGSDVTPIGATTPASTPFAKLNPPIATQVHDPAHADITNSSVGQGTAVHDNVTVSATSTGPTPTGTADFTLHEGLICQGTVLSTESNVALVGGVAESTATTTGAGTFSYSVHYDGDDNYTEATAVCEPFTVDAILPLEVVKTSRTAHQQSWDWTIVKSAATTSLTLAEGESFTVDYTVDVSAVLTEVIDVSGTIAITNPVGNPTATITNVADTLSIDGAATVTCAPNTFPQDLAPGATLNCTYQLAPGAAQDQDNTATVTTSGDVPGGSDTVPVTFDPPTLIDECVDVTDTYTEGPQGVQVCAGDGDDDETFNYSVTFGPDTELTTDVPVACGLNEHPNTASFLVVDDENDTAETGEDSVNVTVDVSCVLGCTLTQGYWKTHNDSFKGGAPTDDNWELITPLAEVTGFFTNDGSSYPAPGLNDAPFTWFDVFWTAPKGNAYYNLAHQYEAATLNALNGASVPTEVQDALDDATAFFETHTPASFAALGKKDQLRKDVLTWAGILGSYNEGAIGPGHCDEQIPV